MTRTLAPRLAILVVGASRGLGLALAGEYCRRGWQVIATARGPSSELARLAADHPGSLEIETVDITLAASVEALRLRVGGRRLDILFINAGIALATGATPGSVDEQDFFAMMLTNALAPARTAEWLGDLVPAGGVIAIMSSELGSIAANDGSWQIYSASKAALSMLMKGYAAKHRDDGHTILLVAPGWVRTDMGGANAALSTEESIPRIVDMIEANRGQAGLRFVDRFNMSLPW